MILFANRPGSVIALRGVGAPATIQSFAQVHVEPLISYRLHRSIITSIAISQQANAQFMHTLGSMVYIYAFGDRIGTMKLGGLSFPETCHDRPDAENVVGNGSLEPMLAWFEQHKVNRRQRPVRITIGRQTTLEGFVTAFTAQITSAENRLAEWSLELATLPQE